MVKYGLKSPYVKKKYKIYSDKSNESKVEDLVKQRFNGRKPLEVVVSDLTYVQVGNSWNYICILQDLSCREIIGYSVAANKTA